MKQDEEKNCRTINEWAFAEWYYKTKHGAFYSRRFARQRSSDTMVVMDQGTDCYWVCTLSSLDGYLDSYNDIVAVYRDGYTQHIDEDMS